MQFRDVFRCCVGDEVCRYVRNVNIQYSTCLGSKELVCKSGAGISNVKCDILIHCHTYSRHFQSECGLILIYM